MSKPWDIYWLRGILILLEDFSFSIDPQSKIAEGDFILISHAHSDHIAGFSSKKPKLASYLTVKLIEALTRRKSRNIIPAFLPSQRFNLAGLEIETYNAGHILGSLQFHFRRRTTTLTYTGDFNLESTLITKAAKPIECDELIIDATYGHPEINFPPREIIYNEIADFIEKAIKNEQPPAFYAYPIGKAQELIALINKYLNLEVIIDGEISRVNKVYKANGYEFKTIKLKSKEASESLKSGSLPIIVSNKNRLKSQEKYNVVKAIATGLAAIWPFKNYYKAFPLSNHSDFKETIQYIEQAKPKQIYTVGYHAQSLAEWIKRNMKTKVNPLI